MAFAWSYLRTSTAGQAKEEKSGMERQEEALASWLKQNPDFELAERLIDPGVSAGKGKHRTKGALARFTNAAREGTIPRGSVLVVESVSRFSREASSDALGSLLNDVFSPGMGIAFTGYDSGRVMNKERWDNEAGLKYGLIAALDAARAEWVEKQARSQGAIRQRNRLQDQGKTVRHAIPWWMERTESGKIKLSPAGKKIVRRAAALVTQGYGRTKVARILQSEGHPTPKGGTWCHSKVRSLIEHKSLTGTLPRAAGDIPGYYPAVLTESEHAEMMAAWTGRGYGPRSRPRAKARNLFQGLSFCAHCGTPLAWKPATKTCSPGHKGYVYCRKGANRVALPDGSFCPSKAKAVSNDAWEAHCLTRLSEAAWEQLLTPEGQDEAMASIQEQLLAAQDELNKAHATEKKRSTKANLVFDDEDSTPEMLKLATSLLKEAKEEVEHKKRAVKALSAELIREQNRGGSAVGIESLRSQIRDFMASMAEATEEERVAFTSFLGSRQPILRFELDVHSPSVGFSVGDGECIQQPLDRDLSLAALQQGMPAAEYGEVDGVDLVDAPR